MDHSVRYTLSEFSRTSGVSVRNIRAYIQSGAVPRPIGRTRGAWYTEEHMAALRAHLVRKATGAMSKSEPAVTPSDVEALPASPAVWVELAPDVKVLLLPNAHGHTQEQLLHIAKMMAVVCVPILRAAPVDARV
jgi:MerR HTH family regulatory protein